MCYSAMVGQDLQHLARIYGAIPDLQQIKNLFERRLTDKAIRVPKAMEFAFAHPDNKDEQVIKTLIDQYKLIQSQQLQQELYKQRERLSVAEAALKKKFTKKATEERRIATNKIEALTRRIADLARDELLDRDHRIFPLDYSFIVVDRGLGHETIAARYHCRPPGLPATIDKDYPGLYNSRRDSLESFWSGLFGRSHAVLQVSAFYENVARHHFEHRELAPGEKVENVVLQFTSNPPKPLTTACLWSHWTSAGQPDLYSFSTVNDNAPADIARTGHDRVSIFLKPDQVDAWLSAQSHTRQELDLTLGDPELLSFEYKVAA